MKKSNKEYGGIKMAQNMGEFIEHLIAVDFNSHSDELNYK